MSGHDEWLVRFGHVVQGLTHLATNVVQGHGSARECGLVSLGLSLFVLRAGVVVQVEREVGVHVEITSAE